MRMFLVGMCDIFLILYLTTLGQVDRNQVSDLTVEDYLELLERADQNEKRVARQRNQLKSLQEEIERRKSASNRSEKTLLALQNELDSKSEALSSALEERDNSRKELIDFKRVNQELTAAKSAALQEAAELEKRIKEQDDDRRELEQELMSAEEEVRRRQELLEQLKRSEELARKEAQRAAKEAKEFKERADRALANEQIAKIRARSAANAAIEAKIDALKANEEATRAAKQREQAKTQLKLVTRPAPKAYSSQVKSALVDVELSTEREALFGTSDDTTRFQLVAARWKNSVIFFLPFSQASLEDPGDSERFLRLDFSAEGVRANRVFVSPVGTPPVIAFAFPATALTAEGLPIARAKRLADLTPTLFALRNGTRMRFSDRIRDLDREYIVFKRDRLSGRDALLQFSLDGFRGTKDFGERLILGDQIVDLSGEVVGIVAKENQVLLIDGLERWASVRLPAANVSSALKLIWANHSGAKD